MKNDQYSIIAGSGVCHVCGSIDDLRYGVCFACSDHVKSDGITAWDASNPENRWSVSEQQLKNQGN